MPVLNEQFICNTCNRGYKSRGWLDNHIRKFHPQNVINNSQNYSSNIHQDDSAGWDKDQLDLALELSMKEQFKDFIPNEDDVLEMSSNKACAICLSKKADVAFINCGHMISCGECANKLKNGRCPVCRKKILKVLKIYT